MVTSNMTFVTHLDGQRVTVCHHCLTPKERESQHPHNEVWEYDSRGWLSVPWCTRCCKSIPVYIDKACLEEFTDSEEREVGINDVVELLAQVSHRVTKLSQCVFKLTQALGQTSEKPE